MLRVYVEKDEIRFTEADRPIAELVARALPEIRRKGEEMVGINAPPVRVVVSGHALRTLDIVRLDAFLLWVLIITVSLLVFIGVDPDYRTFSLVCFTVLFCFAVFIAWRLWRMTKRQWPVVGGFVLMSRAFFSPVIALHWPPPDPPMLTIPLPIKRPETVEELLRHLVSHEYAHVLLRVHYQRDLIPPWFDEGFAFWFSEYVLGENEWLPESRAYVDEPDPAEDPRWHFTGQESYYRLCARYYWEVTALADQGILPEVLRAPFSQLNQFRPDLSASETKPI